MTDATPEAAALATTAPGIPEPAPPVLRWYVCDLLTGVINGELPLTGDGKVRRRIAAVESVTLTLPVFDERCPVDWDAIVIDGKSMIVLTVDAQPAQAWVLIDHTIGDTTVPINASTLEECLSRTNVPDLDPFDPTVMADQDYSTLAAALAAPVAGRFGFVIETEPSGKVFDGTQTYDNTEDRSILSALNEDIMGADGGPEWRVFARWTDETLRGFTKVIEIKPRVGQDRPDAIFDLDANLRGSIEKYTRTSSYAAGKGATMMIGTSDGSGNSRPMTDPQVSTFIDEGWPVWEERKNFTDLDDTGDEDAELLKRTQTTLIERQDGTATWTVTGRATGPQPGRDFEEGDTLPVSVAPNPPRDPSGGSSWLRTLGWEYDLKSKQATPLFWDEGTDGEGDTDG